MFTDDFVVAGTCTEQLYGMCESLWVPNLVSLEYLFFFNVIEDVYYTNITWFEVDLSILSP